MVAGALLVLLLVLSTGWCRSASRTLQQVFVHVDEIGRAEALDYEALTWRNDPLHPSTKYFLRRFVTDHYSCRFVTVTERWPQSLASLERTLAATSHLRTDDQPDRPDDHLLRRGPGGVLGRSRAVVPWQVATGLTLVIVGVSAILLLDRLDYLGGYWGLILASTPGRSPPRYRRPWLASSPRPSGWPARPARPCLAPDRARIPGARRNRAGPQIPGEPAGELVEDRPTPLRVAGKRQLRAALGVVGVQAQSMPSASILEPPGQVQRMGRPEEAR